MCGRCIWYCTCTYENDEPVDDNVPFAVKKVIIVL